MGITLNIEKKFKLVLYYGPYSIIYFRVETKLEFKPPSKFHREGLCVPTQELLELHTGSNNNS